MVAIESTTLGSSGGGGGGHRMMMMMMNAKIGWRNLRRRAFSPTGGLVVVVSVLTVLLMFRGGNSSSSSKDATLLYSGGRMLSSSSSSSSSSSVRGGGGVSSSSSLSSAPQRVTVVRTGPTMKFQPVNCLELLQSAAEETWEFVSNGGTEENATDYALLMDPNLGRLHIQPHTTPSTTTTTTTTTKTPSFAVSLHHANFDRLRWDSIMVKGDYYETDLTKTMVDILLQEARREQQQQQQQQQYGAAAATTSTNKNNMIMIDVGMNIGWYSLLAASLGFTVVAFDPNIIHQVRICQSKLWNGWTSTTKEKEELIYSYPYGVGSELGELTLSYAMNTSGSASFHHHHDDDDTTTTTTTTNNNNNNKEEEDDARDGTRMMQRVERKVPVLTLDAFAHDQGWLDHDHDNHHHIRIPLMKVDVEGYELPVFSGAVQLLSNTNMVQHVISEINMEMVSMTNIQQLFEQMSDNNYVLRRMMNWKGSTIHEISMEDHHHHHKKKKADWNQISEWITQYQTDYPNEVAFNVWWTHVDHI